MSKKLLQLGAIAQEDSTINKFNSIPGLTFLTDTRLGTLNAQYALGTKTSTFNVTRGSVPATYFDANGVMQSTTSNTPRYTYGDYDETGWHAYPGGAVAMLEGQSTNLLVRTDGTASGSGLWTGWSVPETATGDDTPTNVSIPELTSISGAKSQRVQYVGVSGDVGAVMYASGITTAVGSVVQNDVVTLSVWARSTSGNSGVSIHLEFNPRNAAGSGVSGAATSSALTLTSSWRKFTLTATATDVNTSRMIFNFGITSSATSKIDEGDVVDFEIYAPQAEKNLYPSSFIPTTTTALTRPAENPTTGLTYVANDGNFPAPSGNNALSFDGTNDVVTFGNLGNITNVTMRVQLRSDNQELFTVDNTTNGAVKVSGGAITAGASITLGTITVDGVTKSAAEAGALLNDNSYHVISIDMTSIAASDFRLGTDSSAFGDMFVQYLTTTGHSWGMTEGTGTNLADSVGANAGTISGATWSKDTHAGTVVLAYRPVMLPTEQPTSSRELFSYTISEFNVLYKFLYDSNANNKLSFLTRSNGSFFQAISANGYASSWTRNQLHVLTGSFSTTADGSGKKLKFYDNGTNIATNANYPVPAGSLPSTFSIQSSAGQSMHFVGLAIYNRVLSAAEVAKVTQYFN